MSSRLGRVGLSPRAEDGCGIDHALHLLSRQATSRFSVPSTLVWLFPSGSLTDRGNRRDGGFVKNVVHSPAAVAAKGVEGRTKRLRGARFGFFSATFSRLPVERFDSLFDHAPAAPGPRWTR